MHFINIRFRSLAVPLVVVAVAFGPPVVAGAAAQTAVPSHKHYDDSVKTPAPSPGTDAALVTSVRK
jgi:hypothetical protein